MAKANNNRRNTVLVTVIIIFAIALVTIFVFRAIYSNEQPSPSDDNLDPSLPDSSIIDSQTVDNQGETTSTSDDAASITDDSPLQYEGANPNTSATIEAVLTYYGIQNGEYLVNVNISQYLSGTCQITLGTYTGSVTIDQNASNSACSFHIPVDRLQSGLQSLRVIVQSSAATGTIEENIDVSL